MNECLNSDDDDEEAHRWSLPCFFTRNCLNSVDAEIQAIPSVRASCCAEIVPEVDSCQKVRSRDQKSGKHNGLITG